MPGLAWKLPSPFELHSVAFGIVANHCDRSSLPCRPKPEAYSCPLPGLAWTRGASRAADQLGKLSPKRKKTSHSYSDLKTISYCSCRRGRQAARLGQSMQKGHTDRDILDDSHWHRHIFTEQYIEYGLQHIGGHAAMSMESNKCFQGTTSSSHCDTTLTINAINPLFSTLTN